MSSLTENLIVFNELEKDYMSFTNQGEYIKINNNAGGMWRYGFVSSKVTSTENGVKKYSF